MPTWIVEVFHWVALAPLVAVVLRRRNRWAHWLAVAFAVSWIADMIAEFLPPEQRWAVSATYPVTQAGLLYACLTTREQALGLLVVTTVIAFVTALTWATIGPDAALRLVIAVILVWLVQRRWDLGWIRTGLLIYFGAGALCWVWLPFVPRDVLVWPWLGYQGCRMLGLACVTWGLWDERPAVVAHRPGRGDRGGAGDHRGLHPPPAAAQSSAAPQGRLI